MVEHREYGSDRHGWVRRRLAQVTGLALGVAMLGTVGLSGALAQDDDVTAGGDVESIVNTIIEQVWASISGGGAVDDDASVSSGVNMSGGGNMGGSVTMGGGSGGSVNMGGSGGNIMVGDDSGG